MFHSKTLAGIYLVFVMNITAIWLVLTIAILNVHFNTFPRKPVPWIRHLAFNALSKALCVEVPRTDHSDSSDAETLNDRLQSVSRRKVQKLRDQSQYISKKVLALQHWRWACGTCCKQYHMLF